MDFSQRRSVKVRVNALGTRVVGTMEVPPPHFRVSDYLNSHRDFLLVRQEGTEHLIAKDAISYLEALEEGEDTGSRPSNGHFLPVTIVLREHIGTLKGEIFLPEGTDLPAALDKARRFIKVRGVTFAESHETYDFLAVSKQEIVMIRSSHTA
jgi:hypothetical protein